MRKTMTGLLLAGCTLMSAQCIQAAGFKQIVVKHSEDPDLTVGLWYPTDTAVPQKPNTEYGLAVALDADVANTNGGLILISHGYSGWYAGHADTAIALADAGYVVAAPSHTGNTWSDMSSPVSKWMLDRPRHISRVIDHLLSEDSSVASLLEPEKIGVYGFSAGGYTAVGLIGGIPDVAHASKHCQQFPREFACAEGLVSAMSNANMDELAPVAWGADRRIKSAAIAAPGWGFAYPKASLASVTANVQLWSGLLDDSVPTETNAALLATNLPNKAETHWIDKANHFAFMVVPCRDAFKQEDPEEYELVCADVSGFDRLEFHEQMHSEMVRFFDETLGIN